MSIETNNAFNSNEYKDKFKKIQDDFNQSSKLFLTMTNY